jgi:uncharacterized protein
MEFLLAAFMIGLLGSLHCMGMCGPLALMLHARVPGNPLLHNIIYNAGRLLTYTILGMLAATLGRGIALAGWQQTITIATGAIIVLAVVLPAFGKRLPWGDRLVNGISNKVRRGMQYFLPKDSLAGFLGAGMVNGLLPCGLVYVALAGAMNTSGVTQGASFMLVGMAGKYMSLQRRISLRKVLPWFTAAIGVLLIIRGLDLGIPYMSPHTDMQGQVMDCCQAPGVH